MFKAPKQQKPPPPPPPVPLPTEDDATVQARKAQALETMRGRKGRRATLLSAGQLGDAPSSGYKPVLS